uniref:Uncharacterized protein n=1 Tax=Romanomermis culicivorax TaxID=13658 RepID=A0A915LAJ3_ROMCU
MNVEQFHINPNFVLNFDLILPHICRRNVAYDQSGSLFVSNDCLSTILNDGLFVEGPLSNSALNSLGTAFASSEAKGIFVSMLKALTVDFFTSNESSSSVCNEVEVSAPDFFNGGSFASNREISISVSGSCSIISPPMLVNALDFSTVFIGISSS